MAWNSRKTGPPPGLTREDIVLQGKYAGLTYAEREKLMLEGRKKARQKQRADRKAAGLDPYYGQIDKIQEKRERRKAARSKGKLNHEKYGIARAANKKFITNDEGQIEAVGELDVPLDDEMLDALADITRREWGVYRRQLKMNKGRFTALHTASKKLQEEIPELKLDKNGIFDINAANVKRLFEKTWHSIYSEESEVDDEKEGWRPPQPVINYIQQYFKFRPFEKIRFGLLKIITKEGEEIYFETNDEQDVLLEHVEKLWYAKLPVFVIVLKARQIGSSTLWQAVHYCYQSTQSHKQSHIVADIKEKCDGFMEMFNIFHQSEPHWMRPPIVGKNPVKLQGNGVKNAKVRIESAERRENISRGFTFQFNHLSEIPFWPDKDLQSIFNAMTKATSNKWPIIHIEESTGKNVNDVFYTRYFDAKNEKMSGYKAFFFPWFAHKDYALDLPPGMTIAKFRMSLDDADKEMWDRYSLSAEQVHWYVTERSKEISGGDKNDEMFKREYPCNEQEAFLGGNSNFFDTKRNTDDANRTSAEYRRRVDSLSDLKKSISGFLARFNYRTVYPFTRCTLLPDLENLCRNPSFEVNLREGLWTIWEEPRPGHTYVCTADSAIGKEAQKNVATSSDYDAGGVWRITHEPDEPRMIVQVAQYRAKKGPVELAQQMTAASQIYGNEETGERALLIGENTAHGHSFIEEAKRLGANQYQRITYGKNNEVIQQELGFNTTGGVNALGSKSNLLNRLRRAWGGGHVLIMSEVTAMEMGVFVNKDGKLEAMRPHHDDTVMEAAFGIEGLYYLTGDIMPVEIRTTPEMAGILDDDDLWDAPERVDKQEFRRQLLERMGVYTEKSRQQRLSRWL